MTTTPIGPGPLVYAHRGDRSRADDNTMEAYALAIEAGADGIELDVRRTRDGVLILSHDDRVDGREPFASLDFSAVRETFPHVPTLEEAMRAIPRDVFVNVEIKNFSFDAGYDDERTIVDETIEELRGYDEPERILMSSFDPLAVQRMGAVGTEFLRGQLLLAVFPLDAGVTIARDLDADALIPHFSHLKDDAIGAMETIREADLRVIVWGVNTDEEVALAGDCGADAIITDDPARSRRVLDQR